MTRGIVGINTSHLNQTTEQIAPTGVHSFDQRELLLSRSALDLLFARVIASGMVACSSYQTKSLQP
jgi:hypothetical protein